jgi:hypothetical protein
MIPQIPEMVTPKRTGRRTWTVPAAIWSAPLVLVGEWFEVEEVCVDEVEVDMVAVAGVPGLPLVLFGASSSIPSITIPPKTSAGELGLSTLLEASLNFSRVSSALSLHVVSKI